MVIHQCSRFGVKTLDVINHIIWVQLKHPHAAITAESVLLQKYLRMLGSSAEYSWAEGSNGKILREWAAGTTRTIRLTAIEHWIGPFRGCDRCNSSKTESLNAGPGKPDFRTYCSKWGSNPLTTFRIQRRCHSLPWIFPVIIWFKLQQRVPLSFPLLLCE